MGGLVAGLLINVSGITLAHFVLGPGYIKTFVQHLPGPPGAGLFARHLVPRPCPDAEHGAFVYLKTGGAG